MGKKKNSFEKKRSKKQRRKGKIHPLNVEFQRIARRDKKGFLSDQCKEIEENSRGERLDLSSRTLEISRASWYSYKDGHNKGQKWYGPKSTRRY